MADPSSPPPIPRTASTRDALAGAGARSKVHRSASMSALPKTGGTSAASAHSGGSLANHIRVAVRCRPLNADEKAKSTLTAVTSDIENNTILVNYQSVGKKVNKSVQFDKVFGVYSRQSEVYDAMVRPVVDEMLSGYNCTIFAYGPTGTGKTHTMEGDIRNEDMWGMIPRTARTIFETLSDARFDFNLKVSYLELYNEELRDLLNTSVEKPKLRLQEDVNHTVVCKGLEEHSVNTVETCMDLLKRGSRERQTAATFSNHNSSRSHSIFTFKLLVRETVAVGEEVIKTGQLNLVDLAGSECIGISGSRGDMAVEAGNINKSLLTLGRVISALVDGQPHIPYRDSKLTRLLQDSLGGRAKTSIIATVSPSVVSLEESLSTLDYAARARYVKNQPTINSTSQAKHVMKDLHYELESMRSQLQMARDKNGVYLEPREYEELMHKLSAQTMALQEAETTIAVREQEMKSLQDKQQEHLDQIKSLTEERDTLKNTVSRLTEQNQVLSDRLATMFVHAQTQRQVVVEQHRTEQTLRHQATQLQETLRHRDMQLQQLIDRVSLLQTQETQRQTQGQRLIGEVTKGHQLLQEQVQYLQQASLRHRAEVSQQLQTWQAQQREVQALQTQDLQSLLEAQLQGLLLNEDMTGLETHSVDIMREHVQTHVQQWQSQVERIQSQWQEWLLDSEAQVAQVQEVLTGQETHLRDTRACVESQTVRLQDMADQWRQEQEQRRVQTLSLLDAHATRVEAHLSEAKTQVVTQTQVAQAHFAQQLTNFQGQMTQMFAQLSQEYNAFCNTVVQTAETQHDTSHTLTREHVAMCRQLSAETHHTEITQNLDALSTWRDAFATQVLDATHLTGVNHLRDTLAQTHLPHLATFLTVQRQDTLPRHVSSLQDTGVSWAQTTQADIDTTQTLLSDTKTHLQSLHTSLTEDAVRHQDTWTQLLVSQQSDLETHTASVSQRLSEIAATQSEHLDTTATQVSTFATSLAEDLAPHRGGTPVNVPQEEDIDFPVTRNLSEIVQSVVQGYVQEDAAATATHQDTQEEESTSTDETIAAKKDSNKGQQGLWRGTLFEESVAPRYLVDLPPIAVALTQLAIETHKQQ